MPIPSIFPHYSGGENRVTLAMLAVFERISVQLLEQIFRYLTAEDAFEIVRFTSQPPLKTSNHRPDGEISASCQYLFEVKRVPNALGKSQLSEYLKALPTGGSGRLFAITPDSIQPAVIDALVDDRLVWRNFVQLSDAIDQAINDDNERISERDRFLLRELQAFFEEGGLLRLGHDVAVVAASGGYPLYLKHHVYACQPVPKKTFRPGLERLGFYAEGAIQREVPRILRHEPAFELTDEALDRGAASSDPDERALALAMRAMMSDKPGWYEEGAKTQVFLLGAPGEPDTGLLTEPVRNNLKDKTGRGVAFAFSVRYTRSAALEKQPKTTGELIELGG